MKYTNIKNIVNLNVVFFYNSQLVQLFFGSGFEQHIRGEVWAFSPVIVQYTFLISLIKMP